jgi:thioesterase domain-containing protein
MNAISADRTLGWSFGGVVAFEIARALQARSTIVKGLLLIDSPSPSLHVPLSVALVDEVLSSPTNSNRELQKRCKTQFMQNSRLLANYSANKIQAQPSLNLVFLKSSESYKSNDINIPSWVSCPTDDVPHNHGWRSIAGGLIETLDIPGNHFEAFSPENVGAHSRLLLKSCT